MQFPFPGDAITDDTTDSGFLSGDDMDLDSSTNGRSSSRWKSAEESTSVAGGQSVRYAGLPTTLFVLKISVRCRWHFI